MQMTLKNLDLKFIYVSKINKNVEKCREYSVFFYVRGSVCVCVWGVGMGR